MIIVTGVEARLNKTVNYIILLREKKILLSLCAKDVAIKKSEKHYLLRKELLQNMFKIFLKKLV